MTVSWGPLSLLLASIWPLLNALLLGLRHTRPLALAAAPWAALPAVMCALVVTAQQPVANTIASGLLGSAIGLDPLGQTFLLLTALVWLAAGVHARGYIAAEKRTRFYLFFLLSLAGNLHLIVALDTLSFYFGYALMSFAAYGLVLFNGQKSALEAARLYLAFMLLSELLLFAALVLVLQEAGSTNFEVSRRALAEAPNLEFIFWLLWIALGIKAGAIGIHMWLPPTHLETPSPGSAVLAGAMIKAGLLGWLRLLPLGQNSLDAVGPVVLMMGLFGAFYGVVWGVTQRHPKAVLAYSSVSQVGLITAAIGIALLTPSHAAAALTMIAGFAFHHGLNKAALFLGTGLLTPHHRLPRLWQWWLMALLSAALAGAPFTSGMLAKMLLKSQVHHLDLPWAHHLPLVLSLASMATALLMARFLFLLRPGLNGETFAHDSVASRWMIGPWVMLASLTLWLPWVWLPLPHALGLKDIWTSTWPVALALAIAWGGYRWRDWRYIPQIPLIDGIEISNRLFGKTMAKWGTFTGRLRATHWGWPGRARRRAEADLDRVIAWAEAGLSLWSVAMAATMMVGLVFGCYFIVES